MLKINNLKLVHVYTMKLVNFIIQSFMIFIAVSPEVTYKIKELEKCYGNEKFLRIEHCNYTNDYFVHIKAHLITSLDSIVVKKLYFCCRLNINFDF